MCAGKWSDSKTVRPGLSFGVHLSHIVRHRLDLVLGPERAAADHPVEHAFPAAAVLPMIEPHAGAVALEALREHDFLARRVGKSDRLGLLGPWLLLRGRGQRQSQGGKENEVERPHCCAGAPAPIALAPTPSAPLSRAPA